VLRFTVGQNNKATNDNEYQSVDKTPRSKLMNESNIQGMLDKDIQ
jgi:hypothetical protein